MQSVGLTRSDRLLEKQQALFHALRPLTKLIPSSRSKAGKRGAAGTCFCAVEAGKAGSARRV